MLSVRSSIKSTLNSYVRYCVTNLSKEHLKTVAEENKLSVRQHEFKLAQEKYAKHPLILYSTKMEEQVEYMGYRRLKAHQYQEFMKHKRKLREFHKQPLIYDEEFVYNADINMDNNFPSNWMEDYEYFEGCSEGIKQHPPYGTADPKVLPSNVPCSGCGAHLHCTHITLPATVHITRSTIGMKNLSAYPAFYTVIPNVATNDQSE